MSVNNELPSMNSLPSVFRIVSTACVPISNGPGVSYRVGLYHDEACMTVSFTRSHPDIQIRVSQLVSVCWKYPLITTNGTVEVSSLVVLEQPIKDVSLFETVPPSWIKDRRLVNQARWQFYFLPTGLRLTIKAILWDGRRFRAFLEQSASIRAQHVRLIDKQGHANEEVGKVSLHDVRIPRGKMHLNYAEVLLKDVSKIIEYESCA